MGPLTVHAEAVKPLLITQVERDRVRAILLG